MHDECTRKKEFWDWKGSQVGEEYAYVSRNSWRRSATALQATVTSTTMVRALTTLQTNAFIDLRRLKHSTDNTNRISKFLPEQYARRADSDEVIAVHHSGWRESPAAERLRIAGQLHAGRTTASVSKKLIVNDDYILGDDWTDIHCHQCGLAAVALRMMMYAACAVSCRRAPRRQISTGVCDRDGVHVNAARSRRIIDAAELHGQRRQPRPSESAVSTQEGFNYGADKSMLSAVRAEKEVLFRERC